MLKRIILPILIIAGLFIVLDFDYFWKNVQYQLSPRNVRTVFTPRDQMEPNLLVIDSLGIRAPIIYVNEANKDGFQEALQKGVVHFPGTARLGEYGNAYIFGHSSDHAWAKGDYKTVFALLPQIKSGEKIIVSDHEGNKYIYEVKEARVVAKDDTSVLVQDYSKKLLTLQTSYPIGTSLKRFVAVAELIP